MRGAADRRLYNVKDRIQIMWIYMRLRIYIQIYR